MYTPSISEEETTIMNSFDKIIFISREEMEYCQPQLRVQCLYLPMVIEPIQLSSQEITYDLVFTASRQFKNTSGILWFLKNVYPHLNISRMIINGGVVEDIPNKELYPKIDFVRWSENLEEVYSRSKLAIAPIFYGTGVKTKVLTAFSYGIPLIGTSRALQGLAQKCEIGFLISNTSEEMVAAINTIIVNPSILQKMSHDAKQYIELYHSQDIFRGRLREVVFGKHLAQLLNSRDGAVPQENMQKQ